MRIVHNISNKKKCYLKKYNLMEGLNNYADKISVTLHAFQLFKYTFLRRDMHLDIMTFFCNF